MTHDQAREGTPPWEQPEHVEKAASVLWRAAWPGQPYPIDLVAREEMKRRARAVLAAVGPDIAAQAWDEGQRSGSAWGGPAFDPYEPDPPSSNPYAREDADR